MILDLAKSTILATVRCDLELMCPDEHFDFCGRGGTDAGLCGRGNRLSKTWLRFSAPGGLVSTGDAGMTAQGLRMQGGRACWESDFPFSPLPQLLAVPRGWPALRLCGSSSSHRPGMCVPPCSIQGGIGPRRSSFPFAFSLTSSSHLGGVPAPRAPGDPVFPVRLHRAPR